jgi:hypothetical protein
MMSSLRVSPYTQGVVKVAEVIENRKRSDALRLECGSLLPLSACLLAGAPVAGSKLPVPQAGASSRTPDGCDFDGTLALYLGGLERSQ